MNDRLRTLQIEPVTGAIALADEEHRWTFIPERPWGRGLHQLVIRNLIEDLAGNNVGKPFEVDLFDPIQHHLDTSSVTLSFEIR